MSDHTHAAILVGAGFSGIGAAVRLQQQGHTDFLVLERSDGVGGTWRHNTYPGCSCDVQSHLYSFSFAPNPDWSHSFAPQPEILAYLEDCVDRYGLRSKLRLNTAMEDARWEEDNARWRITANGEVLYARNLILGLGPFQEPRIPDIPGLEDFDGPSFHTATWDHSVDLRGKRVAVVGTGASAIQVVPGIAPEVGQLTVFQRTPAWVMARNDRAVSWRRKLAYKTVPGLLWAKRASLYWRLESRAVLMTRRPEVLKVASRLAERHIRSQVVDPDLVRRLTPDYVMGCKRILLSDDYYPTFNQDHVELVSEPLASIEGNTLVTPGGERREVDAIVWATGFHVTDTLPDLPVVGRGGLTIAEAWSSGPEAYLGTAIHGFPNLYMMLGPNMGLGHNSVVFMIESQLEHVIQAVEKVERGGARSVEVRDEAQAAFNDELQRRMGKTVWMTGCRSWYVDPDGKNRTMWPDFTWRYLQRAKQWRDVDYDVLR